MTIERKIIIGIEDIKAVTFECTACLSRLSVNPERIGPKPLKCPHCQQNWSWIEGRSGTSASPFVSFTESIERLRALATNGDVSVGFRILLQFDADEMR